MKKIITLFIFLTSHLLIQAQGGIWTWVKGSDTLNDPGHRGIKGVYNSADYPCGRYQAAQWTDLDGNFWIFGGTDANGSYNDLWKYDPSTNIWTWVNGPSIQNGLGTYTTLGVPGPNNVPSSRQLGCISWTDHQGRLWLYGGEGYDPVGNFGCLADMWMYDIPTTQWTWTKGTSGIANFGLHTVSDTSNNPGVRCESNTAWVKSDGTLWTYGGGTSYGYGLGNDVWKFDISTNIWTWMGGDSTGYVYSYGTKNIEDSTNLPVPSSAYTHWQDGNDNFYIFAGLQIVLGQPGTLAGANPLWRYNTNNNRWTWIAGDSILNVGTTFTHECISGQGAMPSARCEHRSAQLNSSSKLFWTFGGQDNHGSNNDLWVFNNQTLEWTWVSGSDTGYSTGIYGSINVPALSNAPAARAGECFWEDASGVLWVWGGFSNLDGSGGTLNDMWKFVPDTGCVPVCSSFAAPTITHTGNTLTSSSATHYQWQRNGVNIPGDTTSHITITENGTYTVIISNASGCSSSASITIINVGINEPTNSSHITLYPNPATQSCTISIAGYNGENYTVRLTDMTGRELCSPMIFAGSSFTFPVSPYTKGVYTLQITDSHSQQVIKRLLID